MRFILIIWVFIASVMILRPTEMSADPVIDSIHHRIYGWRDAWIKQDMVDYMAYYHPAFRSGELDRKEWGRKKKELFDHSGAFSVDIFGLSVFMQGGHATARFVQRFRGASFYDVGEKILVLEKIGRDWKIISEEWQPLETDIDLPGIEKKTSHPVISDPIAPIGDHKISGEGMSYTADDDGSENVFIRLNKFFIPKIFNLEGENPRIVIDIPNVSRWDQKKTITAGGKRIRRIRSHHHHREGRLRVVMDLNPSDNYIIDQYYDRTENVYCVKVK